jgi:putative glutamine amidotransferase
MKIRPKIGITMRLETNTRRFYLGRDYSEALEAFGAIPIHISLISNESYIKNLLNDLDGVLLPGSDNDIDPLYYGEEPLPKSGRVVPLKDETDFLVLKESEKLKMPFLGICYGMQALNVFRGGNLYQDIETQFENSLKHNQGFPLERNSHTLEIEDASILSRLITKKQVVVVNSHHHQSIRQVGKHLKITGRAKDGVVECIEDTREDRFTIGVQWHPELSWKTDDLSGNVFQEFVTKTFEYAKIRRKK